MLCYGHHHWVLSQTALIDQIISQFGQSAASPLSMPMAPSLKLCHTTSVLNANCQTLAWFPYHSLVGSLLYLAVSTCPDISYAVQQLSQFLGFFSYEHWHAAVLVVQYLKGTQTLQLHLGRSDVLALTGHSDSDWANYLNTCWSVGGVCILVRLRHCLLECMKTNDCGCIIM
jgi:hypothetical protein